MWLRADFIFSRRGLTEENGVISLNEHADSLEKVTTAKRVARVFRDLTRLRPNSVYFYIPQVEYIPGLKTRS